MKWIKLGKVFSPANNYPWMVSHAANPVAEYLIDNTFRIYFTCRNLKNQSYIGSLDLDFISDGFDIIQINENPLLTPGEIGTFDDSGVSLACILNKNGRKYLFYVGWNLGVTVPWRNSIGLAIYDNNQKIFLRNSKAPLMDRNDIDPFSISYPYILKDDTHYHMWYGSNLNWGNNQKDMQHVIKYAYSTDLINWMRTGNICIKPKNSEEYAISRPFVIKENGIYKMWYSYRGNTYRIGYAESSNLIDWIRKDDNTGISPSESGWDSEMICYPFLFDHQGSRYMLYNGNDYGKTGFGLAVLKS